MRKLIAVAGLVLFTGACASTPGNQVVETEETTTTTADRPKVTIKQRMSKDECNDRLATYAEVMTQAEEEIRDIAGRGPTDTEIREVKEFAKQAVKTGRFLIVECGYLDPAAASEVGDELDELERIERTL